MQYRIRLAALSIMTAFAGNSLCTELWRRHLQGKVLDVPCSRRQRQYTRRQIDEGAAVQLAGSRESFGC